MRVYLLTSVPSLLFDAPAPLGLEEFLTRGAARLSEEDLREMEAVLEDPPGGNSSFAKARADAWAALRARNNRERLANLPASEKREDLQAPEPDSGLRADLDAAWREPDPLRRETALLRAEWNWLEERRRATPYSLDDLLGYALQLRLLERRDQWEEAAGQTQFTEHVRSFLEPVLEDTTLQESPA